jgi:3-deoxy-D-manno-octulosonic-acid transferase
VLFLYQTGIRIYYLLILAASPFSRQARNWIRGRQENRHALADYQPDPQKKTIWIHVSSLGEFEQGRPVIEKWKQLNPESRVLVSFFSPSGFNIRKNYPHADLVFYLPPDTRKNMDSLLRKIKPDIFLLVKYDFWPNMLRAVHRNKIPSYLISARFRKGQFLFRPAGRFILDEIRKFEHIFVQDTESVGLLAARGITQVTVAGDTRVDAVMTDDRRPMTDGVTSVVGHPSSVILGSSWPVEEKMFTDVWFSEEMRELRKGWRVIIAPHDVSEGHLRGIEERYGRGVVRGGEVIVRDSEVMVRGGEVLFGSGGEWEVLLVDSVGHLKDLYRYADVAIIGGGFGKGIHNILEPSAFGVPVLFGPRYKKFREAEDLIRIGSAVSFRSREQLSEWIKKYLSDPNEVQNRGILALKYMESQAGSSDLIIRYLMEK